MDIEYREAIPGTGLLVFDCQKLNASLSAASCAKSFLHQQNFACMGCATGRRHAGRRPLPLPRKHYGAFEDIGRFPLAQLIAKKCTRCGDAVPRLIANIICITCYNRQAEVVKGRNGKGRFPRVVAAHLRMGHALVSYEADLAEAFYPAGQKRTSVGGLPVIEDMGGGSFFVSFVVTNAEELRSMVSSVTPEAVIIDCDTGPTFLEMHQPHLAPRPSISSK